MRFFDALVADLAPGESSFASLNSAYQRLRRTWPGISNDPERDDHLYDSLLSLVKVRGRDWSERWDAVRVGLGYDMRARDDVTSGSASGSGMEDTDDIDSVDDVHTLGGSSSTSGSASTSTLRRHSSRWSMHDDDDAADDVDSQWTQETSQSEGSDGDQDTADDGDDTERARRLAKAGGRRSPSSRASSIISHSSLGRRHRRESSSSTIRGDEQTQDSSDRTLQRAPVLSARQRVVDSPGLAALNAKRDALIRQAAQLAQAAKRSSLAPASPSPRRTPVPRPRNSDARVDQLTRLLSKLQHQTGDSPESDETTEVSGSETESQASIPARLAKTTALPTLEPAAHPQPQRQRIDDILASLRSDRESLRETVQRHAEQSEEAAWSGTMRLADRHRNDRLLSKCWTWWRHVDESRVINEDRARSFHRQSSLTSHFREWRDNAAHSRSLNDTATRADHVRALLFGWRVWRRRYQSAKTAAWESRKDEMRQAYSEIKSRRAARAQASALETWHQALLTRRAVNFRNGHLLGGAFFLWKIKRSVSSELGEQYNAVVQRLETRIARSALHHWRRMTAVQTRAEEWDALHQHRTLKTTLDEWRRKTTIVPLATTYAAQRLQRSTLRTWLERLSQSTITKRRQAQAERFQRRTDQRRALQQWRNAQKRQVELERRADTFHTKSGQNLARRSLVQWQLHARASLLLRVRDGRLQKRVVQHWRREVKRTTVDMPRRARRLARRAFRRTAAACLSQWLSRTRQRTHRVQVAQTYSNRNLLRDIVQQWRDATRRHAVRGEEAAAFRDVTLIKGAWSAMRARVQQRRLDALTQRTSTRIAQHALTHWRARATQQALDRLGVAHMTAKRTQRLERTTLRHWLNRVIERRAALIEVGEARDNQLASGALARWRRSLSRVRDVQRLGESFVEIRNEQAQRKHLHAWVIKHRTLRSLRERASRFVASRNAKLQRDALTTWYDGLRESLLHASEYATSLQRQERLKTRALRVWVTKTTHIPALRFHHTKLKFLALQRWRETLPHAVQRREAAEHDAWVLARKAFGHWQDRARGKRAARAAARFGGPSLMRIRRHSARLSGGGAGNPFVVLPRARRRSGGGYSEDVDMPASLEHGQGDEASTSSVRSPTPRARIWSPPPVAPPPRPASVIYPSPSRRARSPARRPRTSIGMGERHSGNATRPARQPNSTFTTMATASLSAASTDDESGVLYQERGADTADSSSAVTTATTTRSHTHSAPFARRSKRDDRPQGSRQQGSPGDDDTSRATPRAASRTGSVDFLEDLRRRRRQVMAQQRAA